MKKALSLFLALVLTYSMGITAFAAAVKITDVGTGFSNLTWGNEGHSVTYGPGSEIDLGTVDPGYAVFAKIPGTGAFIPDSEAYTASPGALRTGYSKQEISKNDLQAKLKIRKGSWAIDTVSIITDGISGEALIAVWFDNIFPRSGSDDLEFDFVVLPSIRGRTYNNVGANISGTLKNDGSYVAPPRRSQRSNNSGNSNRDTTSNTSAPAPVSQATAVNNVKDAVTAAKNSPNGAAVKLQNVTTVSLSTMKEMSKAAGSTALKVNADSLNDDGSVDVRITVEPSQATKEINLSASTSSLTAQIAQMKFAKHFSNTVSAVSLSQKGSFGMPVRVAAKIDPKLNKDTLVFYSYDSETNTFKIIEDPQYKVDKNGYVHFTTSVGGDIIISDKTLAKK